MSEKDWKDCAWKTKKKNFSKGYKRRREEKARGRETGIYVGETPHKCYYYHLTWTASKLKALVHYADLVGLATADTKLRTRPG